MKSIMPVIASHIVVGLYGALLALRLTGWLTWSWWLVLAPIWAVAVLAVPWFLLWRWSEARGGGWM